MTDITEWVKERREFVQESKLRRWGDGDIRRITNAIERVLELHSPREKSFFSSARMIGAEIECTACNREWPCATVRAIEGAINEQ